jgi:hypothetical protein
MTKKPKELVVGRAYRMWAPFRAQPSDQIAVVMEIVQATKTSRCVRVEWLLPGPGWNLDNYSSFLSRVHSEVSLMKHSH